MYQWVIWENIDRHIKIFEFKNWRIHMLMCVKNVQRHKASLQTADTSYPREYILRPLCDDK